MEAFKSLVAEWSRENQSFQRRYPNSKFISSLDSEEVEYLHSRIEEIPAILEMVQSGLSPVPEHAGIQLFRSEVHQALYTSVSGENPSNQKNPRNPVDSVTWAEANTFNNPGPRAVSQCRRPHGAQ
jgi:hypothetical protein